MSGKPSIFPALDHIPTQAQGHVPPAVFDLDTALAAAAAQVTGPGEHFTPHATIDLPDGAGAGLEHASLPDHISDWLLGV